MKAYDALTAQLDGARTEFLSKQAMEISAVGDRLFWLQFPTFSPNQQLRPEERGEAPV